MTLNGLSFVNIELTSRCNKSCWMCGRRKLEAEHPKSCDWGDMDFDLLEALAREIPPGIVVQLHNNGEPTLYPRLRDALRLFPDNLVGFDTNGKLLVDRADEIIDELDTLTVSIIENDPEQAEQMQILDAFLAYKGSMRPRVVLRVLGDVDTAAVIPARAGAACEIVYRVLHAPEGSFDYRKPTVKPEIGICLEVLTKLSIDRFGRVSPCVRLDPLGMGVMGTFLPNRPPPTPGWAPGWLERIWEGVYRQTLLDLHKTGRRHEAPLCSCCDYWGIPRG